MLWPGEHCTLQHELRLLQQETDIHVEEPNYCRRRRCQGTRFAELLIALLDP
jgi:hypothetical protein